MLIVENTRKQPALIVMSEDTPAKRKKYTINIDMRVMEVIDKLARNENTSRNKYLEKHFASLGISQNMLNISFEHIKEQRGGDRSK